MTIGFNHGLLMTLESPASLSHCLLLLNSKCCSYLSLHSSLLLHGVSLVSCSLIIIEETAIDGVRQLDVRDDMIVDIFSQLRLVLMLVWHGAVLFPQLSSCPVGWDCRIHWLHLCRGVRPHPTSVLDMTLNSLMMRSQ